MTDYERWVQQMLNKAAVEEKRDNIYKKCAIDEAIAHLSRQGIGETKIRNAHLKAQADAERDFYK